MNGGHLRAWIEKKAAQVWDAKWILPIILGFAVSILDPFGFSTATDQRSHLVFNRIAAPFYDPQGYNHISVVLIDDDYLDQVGETYPMSRYQFLDIHALLTSVSPRAIFYDFHLPAGRGDEDATRLLGSEIAASAANPKGLAIREGTEDAPFVWFADFGGTAEQQEKYNLFGQVETLPVRSVNVPLGQYAPCQDLNGFASDCGAPDARVSPALGIYNAVCSRLENGACSEAGMSGTMVMQWSRKPEPGRSDCSADPDTFLGDTVLAGRILLSGLIERGQQNPKLAQTCFPFQTIRAFDLSGMSEAALSDAFDNQVVFVGGQFGDAPDTSISPVHGQIPGVFVHATGLENLITFGNRYWRADRRVDGAPLGLKHLIEFMALLAASLIYRRASLFERRQLEVSRHLNDDDIAEIYIARKRMFSASFFLVSQLIALVGIALAMPLALSMPPTNFYGLCTLTVPLMATTFLFSLSNWFLVSIEKGLLSLVVTEITWLRLALATLAIFAALLFFAMRPPADSTDRGFQSQRNMFNFEA